MDKGVDRLLILLPGGGGEGRGLPGQRLWMLIEASEHWTPGRNWPHESTCPSAITTTIQSFTNADAHHSLTLKTSLQLASSSIFFRPKPGLRPSHRLEIKTVASLRSRVFQSTAYYHVHVFPLPCLSIVHTIHIA